MKHAYSIYETKTHLSRLLKRVKAGEEVVISERNVPIAKVIPLSLSSFEEKIKHLSATGTILTAEKKSFPHGIRKPGGVTRFLEERE